MPEPTFVKRTDWPADMTCARCGETIREHRAEGRYPRRRLYCSPVAIQRVIDSGRTYSAPTSEQPESEDAP